MAIRLKIRDTFTLENETWKVAEKDSIKWHDGTKSEEFKIKSSSRNTKYLEIFFDTSSSPKYFLWQAINQNLSVDPTSADDLISFVGLCFPPVIHIVNTDFKFINKQEGVCKSGFDSEDVFALSYADDSGKRLLTIEAWEDGIEVHIGKELPEEKIKNVKTSSKPTPRKKRTLSNPDAQSSSYGDYDKGSRNSSTSSSNVSDSGSNYNFFQIIFVALFVMLFVFLAFIDSCSNNNRTHRSGYSNYRSRSGGFGK